MSRRYDRNGYTSVPEEDEYSLEAILAEYGKGGRQPAQTTEVPEAGAEDSPAPAAEKAPPEPAEAPPAEEALPTEEVPAEDELYQSDAPDRVALKDIMSQTVDAVLEDGDDGVIEQPVSLGERLAALAGAPRRAEAPPPVSGHGAALRSAGGRAGGGSAA